MLKSIYSARTSRSALALGAVVAFLSSCGGGGNESGPAEELFVAPSSITIVGPSTTTCGRGLGPTVFVYGGQPPYKLSNSVPGAMTLNVTRLQNSGDGFTLTFLGACIDGLPVVVEDDMGRLATVTVSNVVAAQ